MILKRLLYLIGYDGHRLRSKMRGGFKVNLTRTSRINPTSRSTCCHKSKTDYSAKGKFKKIIENYAGIRTIVRRALVFTTLLFLFIPVFAVPSIIVTGVAVQPDGSYYAEVPSGETASITIKIQNNENITYRYYIEYNGQLATTLKKDTMVLASGTMFSTGYITINPQTTHFLYLVYTPNQAGTYNNNIKIYFEKQVTTNNTTTWQSAGSSNIVLQIKVISETTTTTTNEQTTTAPTTPTKCLQPLRTKIYKVIYTNSSTDFSINVINACNNVNLTLVDADIEGVPPQVAYIKDTELRTLKPGEIQTIKIHFNGKDINKPTTIEFSIVISGKYGSKFETANVNVVVNVISKEQLSSATPSPEKTYQLKVDYTIQEGYLIIKGAYYEVNNTKVYLPEVPVEVLYEGRKITYTGPLAVQPGETYCISAIAQGFVPFFKCITAPERTLCVALDPEGKDIQGRLYYPDKTRVKIDMIYDCDSGDLVRNYKVFYAGKYVTKDYIVADASGCRQLKITAEGYKEWTKEICGYSKLYVASSLPNKVGNYTISLVGTYIPGTMIKVVKITPSGEVPVGQWSNKEFLLRINEPGDYKLIIKTPLYEDTYQFHVTGEGVSVAPSSVRLFAYIIVIGGGSFLLLTLFMYYIVKKYRAVDMTKALAELDEKLKQLK